MVRVIHAIQVKQVLLKNHRRFSSAASSSLLRRSAASNSFAGGAGSDLRASAIKAESRSWAVMWALELFFASGAAMAFLASVGMGKLRPELFPFIGEHLFARYSHAGFLLY